MNQTTNFDHYLDEIRAFTDEVLIPNEPEMVALGAVPDSIIAQMAAHGLYGFTIPQMYGGRACTMEEQIRLTFEFTRASCVYRSCFSSTVGLASRVLLDHGNDEQKSRWLPGMATGQIQAAFALTEEHAGSDASAVRTSAVQVAGGYRLNGTKRYITNGLSADLLIVFAQLEGVGVSAFLVPKGTAGMSGHAADLMNGHAENAVVYLDFTDVEIPAEGLIGEPGAGLKLALRGINHARTHVAATAVGQGARLLTEMARHTGSRKQFGAPLADLGAVAAKLGSSYAEIAAARALTLQCGRAWDRGVLDHRQISAAKYFATEAVGRVADRAVQVLGGAGIVGPSAVPRIWRDVRALRIYEGASEVHERNLARHLVLETATGPLAWE